jgi:hypothetical protein
LPNGFWDDKSNQRSFFDSVAKELQVHKPEDWTTVKVSDVMWRGGHLLLQKYYSGSLQNALEAVYPEIQWKGQTKTPESNYLLRSHFEQLASTLSIKSPEDWFSVNTRNTSILKPFKGSLLRALSHAFPEQNSYWEGIL